MAQPHSTLRLSEVARNLVIPSGIVTSGYYNIEHRLSDMGVEYDWWQKQAVQLTLGRRVNGLYAATIGGACWSIGRQQGKTFTIGSMLVAMCLEYPGLKVVWTSHHLRTTTNTFRAMQGIVRRKEIAPLLDRTPRSDGIRAANGEQEVRFANGSIIMFGAREAGFGRGIDAVDIMVFDEGQILGLKALEDMIPATNAAKHPHGALVLFIGTPPRPIDDGEAFTNKRQRAIDGLTEDCLWLELSAEPGADPDDREQWARANLSFPKRTPLESMLRMRENLGSDEAWLREALGLWDASNDGRVIPLNVWNAAGDPKSAFHDTLALGIEVSRDLNWASLVIAGRRADGKWHMELVEARSGLEWVPATVKPLLNALEIEAVVVDAGSPSKALLDPLKAAGIIVTCPKVADLGVACADLLLSLESGDLLHTEQPQMAVAAAKAGKRELGVSGMWVWTRKEATADVTPIQAATLALFGAKAAGGSPVTRRNIRRPERRRRKVVVLQ